MKSLTYKHSFLLLLILLSCNKNTKSIIDKDNMDKISDTLTIEQQVDELLAQMTLEEKIGQMNQYNGFWDFTGPAPADGTNSDEKYDNLRKGYVGSMLNVRGVEDVRAVQKVALESRLGIPLIIGSDVVHGFKTLAPIPLAESASWDLEAIQHSARIAAIEASAVGINWTFAPMIDISRDARWGRVMEGGGEDPYLGSKIAVARVRGFQGDDLSAHNTIAATAKHFAGYGFSESGKEYNKTEIGKSTLYNQILPPFKAAVQEANVATVMNGFNEIDGIPVTASKFLQRDILKDGWGFDGFIISDWGSIKEIANWGMAEDLKHTAQIASIAGSDMDMESYAYVNHLADLVNEGKVDVSIIDEATKRILTKKFELGLMDDPYKYCDFDREKELLYHPDHQAAVLDMAKKSIVLLKNENQLLPLRKQGQKIAVIGALANDKNSPLGSWRIGSDDNTAVSLLEGLAAYNGNEVNYAKGADVAIGEVSFVNEVVINETDMSGFDEAIEVARNADVVIMNLGEHGFQSGEARSRTSLDLPGVQQELLEAVFEVNQNIVLVLQNGRPLAISWADENIPAIVEAWQLGSQSGNAIASVLYGDYNPSAKLPMSFPRNVGQMPLYYNVKSTGRSAKEPNVFWSHYIDSERSALYPFGYGLSYSNFEYGGIQQSVLETTIDAGIDISVDITNKSDIAGKEVVQLYIHDIAASVTRPIKELKGFELVELAASETKTINFHLGEKELGFYNNDGKYVVEPGNFTVYVGKDSATDQAISFKLLN